MIDSASTLRTTAYKPRLACFAALGSIWVFVLVTLGAFTTSIAAGMAFPDWPLSNGSINPQGWLQDITMFAEHSHRLSGMLMGLISIGLTSWLWRREERAWLRWLGLAVLATIIFQGFLGGFRVLLNNWQIPGMTMSVGEALRIPHGILAQITVCLLFGIALGSSKTWIENKVPVSCSLRRLGTISCALVLLQLVIAVTMRHNYAGLAIPTFPYSTPQGDLLPALWDFRVAIHFAHRAMAVVLGVTLVSFAWKIRADRGSSTLMHIGAVALVVLLAVQIALGAEIIWRLRQPQVTTTHVLVGSLILALTFSLNLLAHRDVIEGETQASP